MRVWDVAAGYLDRSRLLGEHREIHALLVVIGEGRRGYSRHPETLRWKAHLPALRRRHDLVAAEMTLRGYRHASPAPGPRVGTWPASFLTPPGGQYRLLAVKQGGGSGGRIPLPSEPADLWSSHELSALAREPDPSSPGPAAPEGAEPAETLALLLRLPPSTVGLGRALARLSELVGLGGRVPRDRRQFLAVVAEAALSGQVLPVLRSTALSELAAWL